MVTEGTAKRVLAYRYKEDEITFELTLQSASRANETNAIVVCRDGDDRIVVRAARCRRSSPIVDPYGLCNRPV